MSNQNTSPFGRRPDAKFPGGRKGKMPNDAYDPTNPQTPNDGGTVSTENRVQIDTKGFSLPEGLTKEEARDLLAKLKGETMEVSAVGFPDWALPFLPLLKSFLISLLEKFLGGN